MFEVQKMTINIETMSSEAIQGCDYQEAKQKKRSPMSCKFN